MKTTRYHLKKRLLLTCSFVVMFCSCSDFLDTKPSTEIPSEEALVSLRNLQSAINGCYNIMQQSQYYNYLYLIYGDIRADDIQSDAGSQVSYYLYVYDHHKTDNANKSRGLMWYYPFQLMKNASSIIEAIDGGKVTDGSEEELNKVKGHAIALRAMAHFDLVKVFGYPYKKDGGASLGVPIIDHSVKQDELPQRSSVAETYAFIFRELERAIPLMSHEKDAYNQLNRYGVRALLARAYLYGEQVDKAYQIASGLIDELEQMPKPLYQLYTNANYLNAFSYNSAGTNFDPESLLEIFNTPTDNPGRDGLSYMCSPNGYAENGVTLSFNEFMAQDPDDVRNGILGYYQNGAPYLRKYPGPDDQAAFDNNYPLIRLSEVYLIAAEAAVKGGGDRTKGLAYLNAIVKRGNPNNDVKEADYTLERVLDERRREFIGEGHRYFDLLRNGIVFQRYGGNHYPKATEMEIGWNNFLCILPIPLDQFKLNPTLEQNPGYKKE